MTTEELTRILDGAGYTTEIVMLADGGRLLLLPRMGRVVGLFAPASEENFFWVTPRLFPGEGEPASVTTMHGPGGDRTWLAPELGLFFPGYPDLADYAPPKELGSYEVEGSGAGTLCVSRLEIPFYLPRGTIHCEIVKSWASAPNPLRDEKIWTECGDAQYAGYTQKTSLRLLGPHSEECGPVGIWNLLQLPHGGEFSLPLHNSAPPRVYFGRIADEDLEVRRNLLCYRMRVDGLQKIGVRAAFATGRAAYCYRAASACVLVIRNVIVDPGGEYVDVPWSEAGIPEERGYAFQACNVKNAELGAFSELEYHAPAVGKGTGRIACEDTSQLWAFRGSESSIGILGRSLLSPEFRVPEQ